MAFKITFNRRPRAAAFTLVEMMVAIALGLLVLAGVLFFLSSSAHSSAALDNYFAQDLKTQLALDEMSQQIRQVQKLSNFTTTNLTFVDYDGGTLQFNYNSGSQTLTRIKNGTNQTLLTNCASLQFSLFQSTPLSNTFKPYSTTSSINARVIQFTWNCSNSVPVARSTTESMKSGMVVIRHP